MTPNLRHTVLEFLASLGLHSHDDQQDCFALSFEDQSNLFIEGATNGLVVAFAQRVAEPDVDQCLQRALSAICPEQSVPGLQLGLLGQNCLVFSLFIDEWDVSVVKLQEAVEMTKAMARETLETYSPAFD